MAFSMQDVLLEPYGGQVLRLSVGATTGPDRDARGRRPHRLPHPRRAQLGRGVDPVPFRRRSARSSASPPSRPSFSPQPLERRRPLFAASASAWIGLGSGIFAHCTLTAAMGMAQGGTDRSSCSVSGAPCRPRLPVSAVAAGGLIRDASLGAGQLKGALGTWDGRAEFDRLQLRLPLRDRPALRDPRSHSGPLVRQSHAVRSRSFKLTTSFELADRLGHA